MPNDLVRWNDFHPQFEILFPNTIRDAMDNHHTARVPFQGCTFEIRPRIDGKDFDVYGPAALGQPVR